jgi:hypothetical protein
MICGRAHRVPRTSLTRAFSCLHRARRFFRFWLEPKPQRMLSAMVARFGKWLLVLVATACTLGSGVALAEPFHEEPPNDEADTDPPHERWYGGGRITVLGAF